MFKMNSLISLDDVWVLEYLKEYICSEAFKKNKDKHAFHFFLMKVKEVLTDDTNIVTNCQNFNIISQILHNMYKFMKKMNDETAFFEKIWFFFAAITVQSFQIWVHKAEKLKKTCYFIQHDYSLSFRFEKIVMIKEKYTRSKISKIVYNILYNYDVKVLLSVLKKTVSNMLNKLEKEIASQSLFNKRYAEKHLKSFDNSRIRLDDLDMNDSNSWSQLIQAIAAL